MGKRQKVKILSRCEKCGKPQEPDKEQSTELFEVFDCHEKCAIVVGNLLYALMMDRVTTLQTC